MVDIWERNGVTVHLRRRSLNKINEPLKIRTLATVVRRIEVPLHQDHDPHRRISQIIFRIAFPVVNLLYTFDLKSQ